MGYYDNIERAISTARKHLGLPDYRTPSFTTVNQGVLFFRHNLLCTWNGQLVELTREKVKEMTEGYQLGDF